MAVPRTIRIRMYRIGFGDCFLISFEYGSDLSDGRRERHVLVDFGSTSLARGTGTADVASLIKDHTDGKLDAIVVTHRHRDHMSGFGSKVPGDIIDGLDPGLIVRPWTEDPKAKSDATRPRSRAFVDALAQAQTFAAALSESIPDGARGYLGNLRTMALTQAANQDAIDRLDAWASAGLGAYVAFGGDTRLGEVVPGVRVRVIGPPTVDDFEDITGYARTSPEYWLSQQRLLSAVSKTGLGGALREAGEQIRAGSGDVLRPGPVSWLVERLRDQSIASLLRIVHTLDDALNNSSLILLFEAGKRRLLFPGDAQLENWSYALSDLHGQPVRDWLADVDVYKVGHHGSLNATPRRSLFGLWGLRRDRDRPMTALLSTKEGVHGKSEATAVPRSTLLRALERRMTLRSTEELDADRPWVEIRASTSQSGGFRLVE